MTASHLLIDLISPFLRGRVKHAAAGRHRRAYLGLAEECNESSRTEFAGLAPIREAEPIDHGIESVIGTSLWILPRAIRKRVAIPRSRHVTGSAIDARQCRRLGGVRRTGSTRRQDAREHHHRRQHSHEPGSPNQRVNTRTRDRFGCVHGSFPSAVSTPRSQRHLGL